MAWTRFLADAERLKAKSETSYRHEYLGEVVGSGTQVFENLKLEPIPDEMVRSFDRRLHGVDWGYYPDPWAYNGMQYDAARKTLYIFDEATARRKGNWETADILKAKGPHWKRQNHGGQRGAEKRRGLQRLRLILPERRERPRVCGIQP